MNSLSNPSGKFFHGIWTNAYEVSYSEVKDLLPFEIYDWFMSLGVQSAKVYQAWYQAFGRVEKPENIDPENPNNLIKYYEDMSISHEQMMQLDPVAAKWLLETKQAVQFNVAKIKKDIYCLFLSANDSAIFDEETADELLRGKQYPLMQFEVPLVKQKLNVYEKIDVLEPMVLSVDPAFSASGDRLAITITKTATKEIVATLFTRTGRIEYITELVVHIHRNYFRNSPIVVERNNFGKAVIEQLEKIPDIQKKLFFTYEKKKNGKYNKDVKIYGITTSKENREKYFNTLMNTIHDNPNVVKDKDIINELLTLESKNGKIQAMSGCHDDAVLSYAIALYVIDYMGNFLVKFTRLREEYEISLSKMILMNDDSLSADEMIKQYKQNINLIRNDDEEMSRNILGEFYKNEEFKKLKNPYQMFNILNS